MSLPLIYGLKHNILIIIIILKHNDMKSCLKKPPKEFSLFVEKSQ